MNAVEEFIRIFSTAGMAGVTHSVLGSHKKEKACKICGEPSYGRFCSKLCVKAYHGTKIQREKLRLGGKT